MKQQFRFAELYRNNRNAVEKTLTAIWCGEARNESQKGYVKQLKEIIPEVFAPRDAMPLVQCMNSYESVYPEHEADAEEMLGTLWKKCMPSTDIYYLPYEHQYQCWKTLLKDKSPDGKPMSIVVTTVFYVTSRPGSNRSSCFGASSGHFPLSIKCLNGRSKGTYGKTIGGNEPYFCRVQW